MTISPPKEHGRVEILDLLRAVAVLAVLVFHYSFRGAAADDLTAVSLPALAPFTKYGYLGVQLFFVISGFVIAYSAEGRTALEFAVARASQIYPGFLVCMTLTFIMTLAFGAPRFEASITQWLGNLAIVSPALKQPFMDGAYWSIVYEITFYAWVALLLTFGWFRSRIDAIIVIWLAIAVLNRELGSSVLLRVFLTDQSGFFAAGLVIYEIYCGRRDAMVLLLMTLTVVTATGQALHNVDWDRGHYHLAYSNWVVAGGALFAIAAVALALWVRRVPFSPRVVMAIGGVTYPLYLLHQHIGFIVFNRLAGKMPPALLIVMTATAIVVVAWTIWRFIERPGQQFLKGSLTQLVAQLGQLTARERVSG